MGMGTGMGMACLVLWIFNAHTATSEYATSPFQTF